MIPLTLVAYFLVGKLSSVCVLYGMIIGIGYANLLFLDGFSEAGSIVLYWHVCLCFLFVLILSLPTTGIKNNSMFSVLVFCYSPTPYRCSEFHSRRCVWFRICLL